MTPFVMFVIAVLALDAAHFVADFCFQTSEQALNKSRSNYALATHVFYYAAVFAIFFGLKFALITAILHFIIDWNTSRITSVFWNRFMTAMEPQAKSDAGHMFFVVIGFDQLLHKIQLVLTYLYLVYAR